MALEPVTTRRARAVGHTPHDAQVRVDERVKRILDRRKTAVERARHAARHLESGNMADGDQYATGR
jgi:hypothetical protein